MAMLLVLLLGRILTAFSLFSFSSSFLGSQPLSKNEQLTFAFGGSVRGSIAFAQALQLQAWGIQSNNIIVSTAVLLCIITSVLSGFVLPWLVLPPAPADDQERYPIGTFSMLPATSAASPRLSSLAVKFSDISSDMTVLDGMNRSSSSSRMAFMTLEQAEDSDAEAETVQVPRAYGSLDEESKVNATSKQAGAGAHAETETGTATSRNGSPLTPSAKPARSASVFSPTRYYQNMETGAFSDMLDEMCVIYMV